jgi:uncharacterized DUF497 family protein
MFAQGAGAENLMATGAFPLRGVRSRATIVAEVYKFLYTFTGPVHRETTCLLWFTCLPWFNDVFEGMVVEFEWDEDKRLDVMKRRGVDMLYAALIFEGVVFTKIDDRTDYGEVRLISLGRVQTECFVVVHTNRNGVTRLITA